MEDLKTGDFVKCEKVATFANTWFTKGRIYEVDASGLCPTIRDDEGDANSRFWGDENMPISTFIKL